MMPDGNAGGRFGKGNAPSGVGRVFAATLMAEWTGLEPATPGVTGRYSNQLNYHSDGQFRFVLAVLVGAEGFEPPTFAL